MAVGFVVTNRTASLVLALVLIANAIGVYGGKSELSESEIERRLKQINKPAVKSIESLDGDMIDCVLITDQPAFDHPLLRNHTIQMKPDSYPEGVPPPNEASDGISQLWQMNGECPENTIPIRRTTKEDLLIREDMIKSYRKQSPNNISQSILYDHPAIANEGHEYATMNTEGRFHGAKARLNLWKPRVQSRGEFSLAQIWISSGRPDSDLNTIEAGWEVFPSFYHTDDPRFFIFWTADAYKTGGCRNHDCAGFVQTNRKITLGASISPLSTYHGAQFEIRLLVWKGRKTGHWWLQFGEHVVGYWPNTLVPGLANGATRVDWGGEIVNERANGQHTTTQMGNGHFAGERYRGASYIANLKTVDMSDTLRDVDPKRLQPYVRQPNCYDLMLRSSRTWGTFFFYGGPGRNPRCP